MQAATLDAFLNSCSTPGSGLGEAAETVRRLAEAAVRLRAAILQHAAAEPPGRSVATCNAAGDVQRELDIEADALFLEAARNAPVALYASEELPEPVVLDPSAPIALAVDPLDGSSNIDVNVAIGSIFSLLPATGAPDGGPAAAFLQAGARQIGAGFFIYGPQLALALSLGSGTHLFMHSPRLGTFVQIRESVAVPAETREFAINASNYRHWDEAVRLYVDDCMEGAEGPRDKDFNMRWIASLVAEAYRVLGRGGVFLYPGDARKGYGSGRLRLVYEANPIALLMEQAGGAATDTVHRILDIVPEGLHQRVPLVFGSAAEVARIARYHSGPSAIGERSPLFGNRGLFRA